MVRLIHYQEIEVISDPVEVEIRALEGGYGDGLQVMFPVTDARLVGVVRDEILGSYLADTVMSRVMHADGSYSRIASDADTPPLNAQESFLRERATTRLG